MRQRSIALSIMTCCVDHFITAAGITSGDALILGCRAIDTPFKYRSISQTQAQAQHQGHRSAPAAIHPGDPLGSFRPPFFRFIIGFSFFWPEKIFIKNPQKVVCISSFSSSAFFSFFVFAVWLLIDNIAVALCVDNKFSWDFYGHFPRLFSIFPQPKIVAARNVNSKPQRKRTKNPRNPKNVHFPLFSCSFLFSPHLFLGFFLSFFFV